MREHYWVLHSYYIMWGNFLYYMLVGTWNDILKQKHLLFPSLKPTFMKGEKPLVFENPLLNFTLSYVTKVLRS